MSTLDEARARLAAVVPRAQRALVRLRAELAGEILFNPHARRPPLVSGADENDAAALDAKAERLESIVAALAAVLDLGDGGDEALP